MERFAAMRQNNHGMRGTNKLTIGNLMICVLVVALNVASIRDVMHIGRNEFVTLCLSDLFFPTVALACGFATRRFLKFTFILFVLALAYVLVGVVLTISS
jgi:hypothetical protein